MKIPDPIPLAAYGASILASSALDLRSPNVPAASTPMCRPIVASGAVKAPERPTERQRCVNYFRKMVADL